MFPLRYPWSEQPSTPVQASSTGLGEGLRHLWASDVIGSRVVFDAAGGTNGIFGSGTGGTTGNLWRADGFSEYINFDDAGTGTPDSPVIAVGGSAGNGGPQSNVFSIQARVLVASLGDTTGANTIYGAPLGGVQFRIDNTTGKLNLLKTQTASIGTSTGAVSINTSIDVGVSYDGTVATFYLNGLASGSASSAQTFTTALQYFIGARQATGGSNTERMANGGRIYYLAVWNRPRSASEFQEVAINPWGLFEPRRVWVPQRAGAASPVLSAATLTSIGTTTARPQVALTF